MGRVVKAFCAAPESSARQFWNYRRKFQIYFILFLVAIAYAASRTIAWQMWTVVIFMLTSILRESRSRVNQPPERTTRTDRRADNR